MGLAEQTHNKTLHTHWIVGHGRDPGCGFAWETNMLIRVALSSSMAVISLTKMLMQQETMITSWMIDKMYVVNYFTLPN